MTQKNNRETKTHFINLLQQGKFKDALDFFKTLSEKEQVDHLAKVYRQKEDKLEIIDVSKLKTVSLLNRKIKPGYTYSDFYKAWLPPTTTDEKQKEIIGPYFGFSPPGCVIQAANLENPSEIISIGLASATKEDVLKAVQVHANTEKQRHDSIAKVADKVGETKLLEILD